MNAFAIILRIVWLLFGLTVGYELSKWINQENYELSIILFLPAFLALVAGELFFARMMSKSSNANNSIFQGKSAG